MGCPGTGLADGRLGIPGRGAPGAPGPRVSFATRSGRGGTTGRACGCPARFGLAGGRSGPPPPRLAGAGVPGAGPGAMVALGATREGVRGGGGATGAPGRGGAGVSGIMRGASTKFGGKGCRGPEIICPGFGAGGAGRAGVGAPRLATGGISGPPPPPRGGRNGCTRGRTGAVGILSVVSFACSGSGAGSGSASATAAGASTRTGCVCAGLSSGSGAADSSAVSIRASNSVSSSGPCSSPFSSRSRTVNASSSSNELECVFLPLIPSSGSISRITLGLTSSSRASSLIRILLIVQAAGPETCGFKPALWVLPPSMGTRPRPAKVPQSLS